MTIHIWRNREELEHQVITLHARGMSQRAITLTCGVSRNTVKRILRSHKHHQCAGQDALCKTPPRAPRPSKLNPFLPRVVELLKQYADITSQRIYETLREEGFDGGTTAVKKAVRRLRPKPKPKPSRSTPIYDPGEMAECDWSPYDVVFTDGSQLALQAFGYTLVHSRRKYFGMFLKNDLYALMDGHEQTFARFKGLAKKCKYDSQKPVVLRWEGQQPIFNPRFIAYCTYYEFQPQALRGNPNGKPRVERSFWEFVRSFFNGRSFRNVDDLGQQIIHWLDTIVDHRVRYGTTALERFALEEPHLRALPSHSYDTARVAYRVCSIDGFVDWQGNRYAVPYDHISDILPIRVTQHELFIYGADLACIASHELAPHGLGLKIDPQGFHPPAGHRAAVDADQLRLAFESMGDGAKEFLRLMCQTPHLYWQHHARRILTLRSRFETCHIVTALEHATRYSAFRADSIEQILTVKSNPRTLDEYVSEQTAERLAERLGLDPTVPRDLTEYDRLPLAGVNPAHPATDCHSKEIPSCENNPLIPNTSPIPSPPQAPPSNPMSSPSDCDDTSNSSD